MVISQVLINRSSDCDQSNYNSAEAKETIVDYTVDVYSNPDNNLRALMRKMKGVVSL